MVSPTDRADAAVRVKRVLGVNTGGFTEVFVVASSYNLSMSSRLFKCLVWFIFLAAQAAPVLAQDLVRQRAYLEDEHGALSFEQVRAAEFQPMGLLLNKGFTNSVIWIKLTLDLSKALDVAELRLTPTTIDNVQLYVYSDLGARLLGPISLVERSAQAKTILSLPAGRHNLYLQVRSAGLMMVMPQVFSESYSSYFDRTQARLEGGLTIFILTAFIFSIWIWVQNKEPVFLVFGLQLLIILCQFYLHNDILSLRLSVSAEFNKQLPRVWNMFAVCTSSVVMLVCAIRFKVGALLVNVAKFFAVFFAVLLAAYLMTGTRPLLVFGILVGTVYTFLTQMFWAGYFLNRLRSLASLLLLGAFAIICAAILLQVFWGSLAAHLSLLREIDFFALRALLIPIFMAWLFMVAEHERKTELASTLKLKNDALVLADVEAQRRKIQSYFLAMLTHELKTPLSIIQIAAESLTPSLAGLPSDAKRLLHIQKSVDDMNYVLERCVEIEDDADRNMIPKAARLSIKYLFKDVLSSVDTDRIEVHDDGSDFLISDFQFLRIILTNLLTNAVKYSREDSKIELHAVRQTGESGAVLFKVRNDLGDAGRPDVDELFSRYYRAEGAKKQPGVGLGLWLSQNLALKLGSAIEVQVDAAAIEFSFEVGQDE